MLMMLVWEQRRKLANKRALLITKGYESWSGWQRKELRNLRKTQKLWQQKYRVGIETM